jgi:hypothetical protein
MRRKLLISDVLSAVFLALLLISPIQSAAFMLMIYPPVTPHSRQYKAPRDKKAFSPLA